MRIKYHYCLKKEKRLLDFLNKYQLSYEINDLLQINYSSCIFDLYEDQDIYGKFKVQYPFISRFDSIKTIEYSKDEIENAEWLSVRSKGTKVEWNILKTLSGNPAHISAPFPKRCTTDIQNK